MGLKERKKIIVPIFNADESSDDEIAKPKKAFQSKLSDLTDYEEEEKDILDIKPTKTLFRYRKQVINKSTASRRVKSTSNVNDDESDDEYTSIFKKKPEATKILNLDDDTDLLEIERNEDIHDDMIPNREEIELIKKKRQAIRDKLANQTVVSQDDFKEKQYVKLLNNEEKLDLLETINDNGGLEKANERHDVENIEDYLGDELEDGKLALSKDEIERQQKERRKIIEDAIKNNEGDHNDNQCDINEWESNILKKTQANELNIENSNNNADYVKIRPLPILWDDKDEANEDSFIETELSRLSLEEKKKVLQMKSLDNQHSKLLQEKQELLKELLELVG